MMMMMMMTTTMMMKYLVQVCLAGRRRSRSSWRRWWTRCIRRDSDAARRGWSALSTVSRRWCLLSAWSAPATTSVLLRSPSASAHSTSSPRRRTSQSTAGDFSCNPRTLFGALGCLRGLLDCFPLSFLDLLFDNFYLPPVCIGVGDGGPGRAFAPPPQIRAKTIFFGQKSCKIRAFW